MHEHLKLVYLSLILLYRWPEVRSFRWPPHYKSMGKYWNPFHSKDTHQIGVIISGSCPLWPFMMTQVQVLSSDPAKSHLRSPKFTKVFLLITFDWEKIQTWEWAHCVCHTKAHQMVCEIWPRFGQAWVITWPWPDVKFWIWPFNVILYMFRRALTRETRWCRNRLPNFSYIKSYSSKKKIRKNTIVLTLTWPLESKLLTSPQIWRKKT